MMTEFTLVVPGRPVGKQRPKFSRAQGRSYTPQKTVSYEQRVQGEWIAAGRPRLPDGPLRACLDVVYERPAAHRKLNGELSAAGKRSPFPMPQTDLDNVVKMLDAFNGCAFKDDRQIVSIFAARRWATDGEREHVKFYLAVVE